MLSLNSRDLMMLFSAPMTFCSWPAKVCTMYQRPGRSKALSTTGSSTSSMIVTSRISGSSTCGSWFKVVSMSLIVIALLLEEERYELREAVTEAENQRGHEHEDEEDDGRVIDHFGTRRPRDLAHLLADLTKELSGLRALSASTLQILRRRGASRCGGAVGTHLTLSLDHALLFAVHLTSLDIRSGTSCRNIPRAGQEGLEPPTPGFGDRCSTNSATALCGPPPKPGGWP